MLKILILTMKEFPERIKKMELLIEQLKTELEINVEIFNGVNGKNIDIYDTENTYIKKLQYGKKEFLYNRNIRLNKQVMSRGEFGCAMSHINIYTKLVEDEKYDNYLILEDDANLVESFEKLKNILNNLPSDFDLLHLSKAEWYPFVKIKNINEYFYIPLKQFFNRTTGYIVSKKGANKLLKYTNGYICVPADDLLSSIYMNTDFNLYVPENYLFMERENTVSTIKSIDENK
jgi:glycosyl transferase family 25